MKFQECNWSVPASNVLAYSTKFASCRESPRFLCNFVWCNENQRQMSGALESELREILRIFFFFGAGKKLIWIQVLNKTKKQVILKPEFLSLVFAMYQEQRNLNPAEDLLSISLVQSTDPKCKNRKKEQKTLPGHVPQHFLSTSRSRSPWFSFVEEEECTFCNRFQGFCFSYSAQNALRSWRLLLQEQQRLKNNLPGMWEEKRETRGGEIT